MNNISLIGRLTRDPELRSTSAGTSVCSMRLAVDRSGPMIDGTPGAGYFDVTSWGNQAESCAKYLSKGSQVGITGSLRWREWETDEGYKRQAVEVNASHVKFLGSKNDNSSGGSRGSNDDSFGSDYDDDIPF